MEFRVLGPLVVWDGGEVRVGAAKQRALLALLLLRRGELVPTSVLVDRLWDGRPPATAVKTAQVYVSQLRKLLGEGLIETRPGGYLLRLEPDQLDAARYETLLAQARERLAQGDAAAAHERIREALALWRGPPLAEFGYESFARDEIRRLDELRLAALELRLETELALGRHTEAVPELETLIEAHPLRENLRRLLILALYRSDRQADALEAYRQTRSTLRDELGLDPSPTLQHLETAILDHDPALEAPGPAVPPVPQPSGTVTLVFTDIESSTELLTTLGRDAYQQALAEHRHTLREAFARYDGYEVDSAGDGLFYAFPTATGAVSAVTEAMTALEDGAVRVRVGIHTGEPGLDPPKYVGLDVHTAARIMAAGHGGQALLSQSTVDIVGDRFALRDLGEHRLKDLNAPERLYQLGEGAFPPLRTLYFTNLPIPASSFVGRERELAEVTSLLREEGKRLVTLTGPGGSGKTRLAVAAATGVVGACPDGVFWIGLAGLREPALVVETIAQTLGARGELAEQIGSRSLLLLLDNFEHLIDAAPELSTLLGACPNLRLLVTSRELLRLHGEVEYRVPPLAPAEAEELFCARSRLVRDEQVAALCRHLDDLPLAVELAAARTAVLSPAQINDRLSQRLDLFRGGRDADPRQQTLRATIEWSYELLAEPERRLFERLSVFAGGCTLEAAEEVVGAEVDALQSLVDKSLVRWADGRFWMLETIGELARERLDASGENVERGRRHATYFLAFAERAEPALKGAEQPAWLDRLEDDHDNLRSSLDWFLGHGEPEPALRLAAALWWFWYMHGHVNEARRWLRRTLETTPDVSSEKRSRVLDAAGYLAHDQGDEHEAIGLLEASLAGAKQVGATGAAALAAAHVCAVQIGRHPQMAVTTGKEAVALAREAGDDYALAIALNNLGEATRTLGDNERATTYYQESLELRRRMGDLSRIALSLGNLGEMALLAGETDRAGALFAEAIEIASEIGDKRHACFGLGGLGWIAYLEGRWEEAEANACESLRLAREIGMKLAIVDAMFCLAGIAAATGDAARAARLAAAAELHRSRLAPYATLTDAGFHEAGIENAKTAAGRETWEQAWAAGAAMSLDEAAEQALSGL